MKDPDLDVGDGDGDVGDDGDGDDGQCTHCGSERLARLVIEEGRPLWIADVSEDPRCAGDALAPKGLRSVYAFPDPVPGRLRGRGRAAQPPAAPARPLRRRPHGRGGRPPGRTAARVGLAGRAREPGRGAARGSAAQRVPAAGRPGALRVRRLRRNGRAPGPGLGAGAGRPLPHRPRGRRQADAPNGRLARRSGQAPARRGAQELVRPAGLGQRPDHGGDAHRPLHVECRRVRRVPPGEPAATRVTTPSSRSSATART